jgi:hypothetical protein
MVPVAGATVAGASVAGATVDGEAPIVEDDDGEAAPRVPGRLSMVVALGVVVRLPLEFSDCEGEPGWDDIELSPLEPPADWANAPAVASRPARSRGRVLLVITIPS